jgi:hypothetical protein
MVGTLLWRARLTCSCGWRGTSVPEAGLSGISLKSCCSRRILRRQAPGYRLGYWAAELLRLSSSCCCPSCGSSRENVDPFSSPYVWRHRSPSTSGLAVIDFRDSVHLAKGFGDNCAACCAPSIKVVPVRVGPYHNPPLDLIGLTTYSYFPALL